MVHSGIRPSAPEARLMGGNIFRVKSFIFHPADSWGRLTLDTWDVTKSLL
jgi:hypothetical protein